MEPRTPSLNRVIIAGNLGMDPELRHLSNGTAFLVLRVCNTQSYKQDDEWKKRSTWFEASYFGRGAERMHSQLAKGSPVIVEGSLQEDKWTDKQTQEQRSRLKVNAQMVHILTKDESYSGQQRAPMTDDDIPF